MTASSQGEFEALQVENLMLKQRVTDLEKQVEDLRRQQDFPLSLDRLGLVDERYFNRRLKEALLSAERYDRFVSVVLVGVTGGDEQAGTGYKALEFAAKLREELRGTDIVSFTESGRVFVLLEEAETYQAFQALRRVQHEMVDIPPADYSVACYPNDSSREETLLELLDIRLKELRFSTSNCQPRVHLGSEVLSLQN